MQDVSWDDLKIAYQVARLGSLSKAGAHLGINHATVLRHINALEEGLDCKLFIRHQRGYRLTEAGQLMLSQMPPILAQIGRLTHAVASVDNQITGTLRITTLPEYSAFLHPVLKECREAYPELRIQVLATDEVLSLSSGAVHVAIRAGWEPDGADLIVRKLLDIRFGYYAARTYVARFGLPASKAQYRRHHWILPSGHKRNIPFVKAMLANLSEENIAYQSNNFSDIQSAIVAGLGIGPIDRDKARALADLTEIKTGPESQDSALWFAYHRDLKGSARVQALYRILTGYIARQQGQPRAQASG
ncbi:LysR family transcriptional regulator [Gallaecimonas sp. GXIMD4217]|uniref:LysR family transcriptional regulator n=1 Tax=Gallaecimonas sp. GXIMD4217 TaxID=3131927 RepID=UPI00311AF4E7